MLTELPSPESCRVCFDRPSATALLVGKVTLPTCAECARRLIDGEFLYAPRPELQLRHGGLQAVGDGPVAFPARALH